MTLLVPLTSSLGGLRHKALYLHFPDSQISLTVNRQAGEQVCVWGGSIPRLQWACRPLVRIISDKIGNQIRGMLLGRGYEVARKGTFLCKFLFGSKKHFLNTFLCKPLREPQHVSAVQALPGSNQDRVCEGTRDCRGKEERSNCINQLSITYKLLFAPS